MQVRRWVETPLLSLLVGLLGITFTLGNNQMKNWGVSKDSLCRFYTTVGIQLAIHESEEVVVVKKLRRYYHSLIVHFGMTEKILSSPCGTAKPITNTHLH